MLDNNSYTDDMIKLIQSTLSLSDYEANIISSIGKDLLKPLPTTQVGIESRVSVLDSNRALLINLIYSISESSLKVEHNYKNLYDIKYVTLTRAGRPNHNSVDAEIHTDENMRSQRLLIKNYESLRSMLFGYLKTLDSVKESCMQKWKTGGYM